MKYTGPKAKRARRQGMNLYGTDKYDKILQRKPYGPGKGPKSNTRVKLSEYALQLKEKQKVRDMYGLSEKQFHNYYLSASKVSGQTGDALKRLLEQRLDNVIYRAGFAMTRMQARQFVSHGHFTVKGRRVKVPSYQVKPGEEIVARASSKVSPVFGPILASHEKYLPPNWLKVDPVSMKIDIVAAPDPTHAEQSIEMRQIVEFYSRN